MKKELDYDIIQKMKGLQKRVNLQTAPQQNIYEGVKQRQLQSQQNVQNSQQTVQTKLPRIRQQSQNYDKTKYDSQFVWEMTQRFFPETDQIQILQNNQKTTNNRDQKVGQNIPQQKQVFNQTLKEKNKQNNTSKMKLKLSQQIQETEPQVEEIIERIEVDSEYKSSQNVSHVVQKQQPESTLIINKEKVVFDSNTLVSQIEQTQQQSQTTQSFYQNSKI